MISFLKKYVAPHISRLSLLHQKSFLDIENFPQISRSRYFPKFLLELLEDFLDFVVYKTNANFAFKPLWQGILKEDFERILLCSPEVGGSSYLLAKSLMEEYPDREVLIMPQSLIPGRRARLDRAMQWDSRDLKTWHQQENRKSKVFSISINAAHRMNHADFKEYLSSLTRFSDALLIGESNNKSFYQLIGMILFVPLLIIVLTPFMRPMRPLRILLTYVIPLLPVLIVLDGIAALFRIRSPESILQVARGLGQGPWDWKSGKLPNSRGGFVTFLLGVKAQNAQASNIRTGESRDSSP